MKILFIADSSLTNPILHSQGIPLISSISDDNNKSVIISFETKETIKKSKEIIKGLTSKVIFYPIVLRFNKLLLGGTSNIIWGLITAIKVIKRNNISVIHARSLLPAIIALLLKIVSFSNIKFIYDNRGLLIDEEIYRGNWKESSIRVRIIRLIEYYVLLKADNIVVVSSKFRDYLLTQKRYSKINLINKLSVIINRTMINPLSSKDDISMIKNNITVRIVFSGSAVKWQNLVELRKVFKYSLQIFNKVEFLIISYDKEIFLRAFSEDKDIIEKLEIVNVAPKEVFNYLIKCNFGLLLRDNNLINYVAYPLKFAEYLSAGLPIMLTSGIGDTEDLVLENNIGAIVKKGDIVSALKNMKLLLDDRDVYLRCRMIAEKKLNIEYSFMEYKNIYKKLSLGENET
jgi:glycosyltransferase involved in cell wall biosynthesis